MSKPSRLQADIDKILSEYAADTTRTVGELAKDFGKKGVKALKNASKVFNGNRYAKSWKVTMEETRYGTTAVIHSTTPGLPHLLEKGHALRNGLRSPGTVHIAPVEEDLVKGFRRAVENDL